MTNNLTYLQTLRIKLGKAIENRNKDGESYWKSLVWLELSENDQKISLIKARDIIFKLFSEISPMGTLNKELTLRTIMKIDLVRIILNEVVKSEESKKEKKESKP